MTTYMTQVQQDRADFHRLYGKIEATELSPYHNSSLRTLTDGTVLILLLDQTKVVIPDDIGLEPIKSFNGFAKLYLHCKKLPLFDAKHFFQWYHLVYS